MQIMLKPSPRLLKTLINLWPPFLGAGIKVRHIASDWKQVDVRLRLGVSNRNYVGVHFGGSLYAMTDPFFMLMLMQSLGPDYLVWDKAASIEYHKPGKGDVTARFRLDEAQLHDIRQRTADGNKYLPELAVEIRDESGDIVATVLKTLYIRRKKGR
ncbi:MAG: YiiD C-terminal domain-containing protein [Aquitalea sp.]|nr:YiiD C-terminal domain-containing protein [Aquitalea sp.]